MSAIQPYTLRQADALIKDAIKRSQPRWNVWRALELLYRRGDAHESLTVADVPALLWQEMPGLTLDAINLVLPNAQIIIASMYDHDPGFLVEPYSGEDEAEQGAKYGEQLLRYFWKRTDGTDIHRSMAQDAVILGNGFAKVGWAFGIEELPREDDELVEELLGLEEAEWMDADLEEREPRKLTELVDNLPLTEPWVAQDEPFVEYVSPYDIFVPRHARRIGDCRWIGQRVILPRDEIEANENFDQDAVEHLKWGVDSEDRPMSRGAEEDDDEATGSEGGDPDPFEEAALIEFYDMRTRTMMVFQENTGKPLYEGDLPYAHRHPPFVHLRNLEDGGRRFWSFGDVENVAAIQAEFNQYVFEQMASARRSGNKIGYKKGVLDKEAKDALKSEQGDIVFEIDTNEDINTVISRIQRDPLPAEVFQGKHDMADSVRDVMGISEVQAGGGLGDRASATEAAVVDGNATLRTSDKKWQVEKAAAHAGLLMLLLCQQYLEDDVALRIVGTDGVVQWKNVSNKDIEGEYAVNVSAGSTMAVNPATRMARALDVMTEIIPGIAADGYDTHPFWRQALRDYGLDPDRLLRKAPLPALPPGAPDGAEGGTDPTVPQEEMGGPPVPAAVQGDIAL